MLGLGQNNGAMLWLEQPGGKTWRRAEGEEIEGVLLDNNDTVCVFNPRPRHRVEPWQGDRWTVTAFAARSYPEASKLERKALRDLGFPVPSRHDIRGHARNGQGSELQDCLQHRGHRSFLATWSTPTPKSL